MVKSLHSGDPDVICPVWQRICGLASVDALAAGRCFAAALQVLFGLHFSAIHVCSCSTCTGGSHVESILHWSRSFLIFRIAINKLFKWLLSRVFASHRWGLGSILGRDITVLGPLVKDGDDLGQVSSIHSLPVVIVLEISKKFEPLSRIRIRWIRNYLASCIRIPLLIKDS
jgi:hypothetical protein